VNSNIFKVTSFSNLGLVHMNHDGEIKDLQSRMKEDWDQRVRHDYRYWMSDGVKSDEDMWLTGERDFDILTNGLSDDFLRDASVLDLGCGVGRILKTAARVCREAIGLDVSEEAIQTAKKLLKAESNIRLYQGDGFGLQSLDEHEINLVISFAALGSMPTRVMAGYLKELSRVVVPGGCIRLQIYLGKEQEISEEDTLALRSYDEDRFFSALERAGFVKDYAQEVLLPFEVSDYHNGIIAYIIGAKRSSHPSQSIEEIHSSLVCQKEHQAGNTWSGSKTAYLVSLARAEQRLQQGELDKADEAVRLACLDYHGVKEEAEIILNKINHAREKSTPNVPMRNKGLPIITEEKKLLSSFESDLKIKNPQIKVFETSEGTTLEMYGFCLSHKTNPVKAAENWAKRTIHSLKNKSTPVLLVGLGDGIFANKLCDFLGHQIYVYETNCELLSIVGPRLNKLITLIKDSHSLDALIQSQFQEYFLELVILPAAPFYMEDEVDLVKRKVHSKYLLSTLDPSVAIVGPLYGGSLPIAEYVNRAFRSIGINSNYVNLSPYYPSFTSFESFLKRKESKSNLENQFVELMSELVMQIVEERKIDILISVAQAPLTTKVLEKCREKGVVTAHWFMEDVDRFPAWKQIAKYYDYFFVIQKGQAIRMVENAGGKRVHYLPLACDPEVHTQIFLSPEEKEEFGSEVSFLGAGYNNRRYVFSKLADMDFKIWGTEWPNVLPFSRLVQRKGARIPVSEYVKIFNGSQINLNLHSSQERNGIDPTGDFINPRTFELAACKSFQLVDNRSLLAELFSEDELVTFENESELKDKIKYFLSNPHERIPYIENAYRKVISEHTYAHRVKSMLEYMYADFGSHLMERSSHDVWKRTFDAAKSYEALLPVLKKVKARGDEPTLEALSRDLLNSKGVLSDTDKKIMFLHHMRGQVQHMNKLRNSNEV
jgi:spore maturation protein CgeB